MGYVDIGELMIEEIKVIKNEKNTLEVELVGAEEGFGEILSYYLNKEGDTEFSAYKKEHPLTRSIKIVIKTSKGDPKKKLLSALKAVKEETEKMEELFKKA